MSAKNLVKRDQKHLWHPLTQHLTATSPIGIVKAKDALLWDDEDHEYIDAISSWYTTIYGHCNAYITAAITKQMQQLDFIMFSGFTHEPAVQLSERLIDILPNNQTKIFFNDNGSTAIEAGIKMALQYYHNKGEKRDTLIAFEDGFHGDTFGAMSASGISSYNGPFEDFLLNVKRIPPPQDDTIAQILATLKTIIETNACAAFIFEPLVQGAAGMKFHSAKGLDVLIKKCKEAGVLCIADEIMTGFGKTGKNFACEYLKNTPDIMCFSKALTAGMFSLSITSCTQAIFDRFLSKKIHKGFFHAHTFSAHPLGCTAALAGIKLLTDPKIIERRTYIETSHIQFSATIKNNPKVKDVRHLGVILAIDLDIEMSRYGNLRDQLYHFFMERGVVLRPLGNTVYIVPPYVITDEQLRKVYDTIKEALEIF